MRVAPALRPIDRPSPCARATQSLKSVTMPAGSRKPSCVIRCGCVDDLDDLCELERQVFAHDNMSRRSLRHFLVAASAEVVVAEHDGRIAGCAVVLFRPNSLIARLYSIAVAPHSAGRGLGPALLVAAERAALAKRRQVLRLEVHVRNHRAIARYRKAGYQQCGRLLRYYPDRGDALRFEKQLSRTSAARRK
jgi:[ribosomal protein S18]-alanine N-acetyltransferase